MIGKKLTNLVLLMLVKSFTVAYFTSVKWRLAELDTGCLFIYLFGCSVGWNKYIQKKRLLPLSVTSQIR